VAPVGTFGTAFFHQTYQSSLSTQVKDTSEDKGRPAWVNFKRVIWHDAFYKLVESIEAYSETGYWVDCGDRARRRIFPLILILAADYEEQ